MAKKVFLGVGHGGSDPGAVYGGIHEAELNLAIALAAGETLRRHGVEVLLSRYADEDDTLPEEIRECNAYGPDVAVDIHNNAGGGDGAEAYYYTGGGTSKDLAENILAEITAIGQNSRGAKPNIINGITEYFGFIRETYAPAVIVECAFVDNAADMEILDTDGELWRMGGAVARGILRTLGVEYIPGDVNGDGRVNLADAGLIMRHVAGHDVKADTFAADVNGDGKVSLTDAAALMRGIAQRGRRY